MSMPKASPLIAQSMLLAALLALSPPRASAQVAYSTFGPGDSYGPDAYAVQYFQSVAQTFRYAGSTGSELVQIRLALWVDDSPYSIQFWRGTNLNVATLLESWNLSVPAEGIYALSSAVRPILTAGEDYWISAENSGSTGAWSRNNQGIIGTGGRFPPSDIWVIFPNPEDLVNFPDRPSAAYDVTVRGTAEVVPEPTTISLLAAGFVGLAGMGRRQRKA